MTIEKGCDRVILEKSAKLYLAYLCVRKSDICFLFLFLFNNLEYIVLFIFYQIFWFYFIFSVPFFFLSQRDTRSPTKLLAFLTSKKKKKGKTDKKKNRLQQKWNVALTLFLYIKKTILFCTIWLWMKNFCGVILDVLLCVLTKLVFLPSQNIQYSSISTVLTSCKLFIVLWPIRHYQREVTYRMHIYPVLLHSEGQGHLTSLYYCYFYY